MTYIEDLIEDICFGKYQSIGNNIVPRDKSVLFSIAKQLRKPLALTSRQADLLIKILKNNNIFYENIPNFEKIINNPFFKDTFRVIDLSRKVYILDIDNKPYLAIKSVFDHKISKTLSLIKVSYNASKKAHVLALSENNIVKIVDALEGFNFEFEPKILFWYNECKKIIENKNNYVPCVSIENNKIKIENSSKSTLDFFKFNESNNILSNLILAKRMGLKISESAQNYINSREISHLLKSILTTNSERFSFISEDSRNLDNIKDLICSAEIFPTLVVMADNDSLHDRIKNWHSSLTKNISNEEISVLFRSENNKDFNQNVKDLKMNNLVDKNTKVVFVKHKIPKILYKINFEPKMIISETMYHPHYSSQKMVESHPLVLYYTDHTRNDLGKNIVNL